jgi:acetyl-CoA synthetase
LAPGAWPAIIILGGKPMKDIIWEPYGDYLEKSNIARFMKKHKIKDYDQLIKRSTSDIEWFWNAALKDLGVKWYTPYTRLLDRSEEHTSELQSLS